MIELEIGGIDVTNYLTSYREGVEEKIDTVTSPTGAVFSDLAYRRHVIEATVEDLPCTSGGAVGVTVLAALRTRPCAVTYFDTATGATDTGNFVCEEVPRPKVLYLDGGAPVYEAFEIKLVAVKGVSA
ncbi:MAG: hypothetical protein GX625_19770 [Clostridiaceae bacterium]|nr:hypothetical protein [Clostridiaceae bacterium]